MDEQQVKDIDNMPARQHPDYKSEIVHIVRSNLSPKVMYEKLQDYHENDIAAALELLRKDERSKLYSLFDAEALSNILEYSENLNEYISELNVLKKVEVLSEFEIQTTIECLHHLSKTERNIIIDLMVDDVKKEVALLSSFDEDEIGSKMTTNYIAIPSDITVRDAMRELINQAAENDNISTLYVIDRENTFVGAIDLKDLILARRGSDLMEIVMTSYPYVYANEQIDDCIERIKGYSEDSIPVLDNHNHLRGVLTAQDLTQLVDDEMGEDYVRLAGILSEEDLQEPLRKSIVKRLPWLIVLLGLGLIVSSVVGVFENVISQLALIVSFQSLVLGMAGNVGTQSLAVTIRVLMDEEVSARQKLFLIFKEARIGLVNGSLLGTLSFTFVGVFLYFFKNQTFEQSFTISLCTGLAMLLSMVVSSIVGTTIPIIFKKIKIDPAAASGPLITTINDLVAVVSYYGLAWLFLISTAIH